MSYSQNEEDLFVLNYFGDFKGTLLEIGANDGITFSNSRLLIENGWKAHLVEPNNDRNHDLLVLYHNVLNEKVMIYQCGIGLKTISAAAFYKSGPHVIGGNDKGLVSTFEFQETRRWPDTDFEADTVDIVTWGFFQQYSSRNAKYDFISIDAEGYDWDILQQINLEEVGCKCLIIEWNSDPKLLQLFTDYCKGFTLAVQNAENLIFTRP